VVPFDSLHSVILSSFAFRLFPPPQAQRPTPNAFFKKSFTFLPWTANVQPPPCTLARMKMISSHGFGAPTRCNPVAAREPPPARWGRLNPTPRLKPWRSAIGSWPCGHLRPIATDLNAQTRALAKATPRDQRAESPFAEPVPQVSQPAVSPISQSAGRSEVCRAQSPVPPDIRNSKLETRNPRNPPQSNRIRPFKPSRTRSLLPPA
jgi:hypothetical protein